jgi:hypothetical protein
MITRKMTKKTTTMMMTMMKKKTTAKRRKANKTNPRTRDDRYTSRAIKSCNCSGTQDLAAYSPQTSPRVVDSGDVG